MKEKKIYYKLVNDAYPGGLFYEDKADALLQSVEDRNNGFPTYVRAVRMDENVVNRYPEP